MLVLWCFTAGAIDMYSASADWWCCSEENGSKDGSKGFGCSSQRGVLELAVPDICSQLYLDHGI